MKKQNPLITGLLLVLLVGLLGFMLLVRPARASVDDANSDLDSITGQLSDTQLRIKALTPDPNDPELADLRTKVPPEADQSGYLTQLAALAESTLVRLTDIRFDPPLKPEQGAGSLINVALSAEGTRAALDAFVGGLASLPRLTVTNRVSLQRAAEATPAAELSSQNDGAPAETPPDDTGVPPTVADAAPTPPADQFTVALNLSIRSGLDVESAG